MLPILRQLVTIANRRIAYWLLPGMQRLTSPVIINLKAQSLDALQLMLSSRRQGNHFLLVSTGGAGALGVLSWTL